MREVEAFSYWPDHASAISGFGGRRRSPDPRYCFHTLYNDVRPGHARYVLRLHGVRATSGELSLRVHAFRPPDDSQISLVSGGRLILSEADPDDVAVEVSFAALRGVLYAFYGYFSEDSDIEADHVHVELIESEEDEAVYVAPPRSVMAVDDVPGEVRPANALVHVGPIRFDMPISQDCTFAQIQALHLAHGHSQPRVRNENPGRDVLSGWREAVSLAALPTYGVVMAGLDGVVVGPVSARMRQGLDDSSFIMDYVDETPPPPDHGAFADFLLWPHAEGIAEDLVDRWARIEGALGRLKIGGLAVIGLTYRMQADLVGSTAAAQHDGLSRNEIGQWVLRLIGRGYAVAPLAYGSPGELFLDDAGQASCVLVARRT